MKRLALALLLALLLLLGSPVAAEPPALKGAQLALTQSGITARWEPPAGQAMVCAIHRGNRAALEPCYQGAGGQHTFLRPQDVNLQVAAGDEVDLYAYDSQGRIIAWQRLPVADHWRTYIPAAGQ